LEVALFGEMLTILYWRLGFLRPVICYAVFLEADLGGGVLAIFYWRLLLISSVFPFQQKRNRVLLKNLITIIPNSLKLLVVLVSQGDHFTTSVGP